MTAREVAQHLNAKEVKRGKLWMAICPAHPDRHPSLSIQDGKKGVQLYCQSHHCDFFDIVQAAGLKPEMLFYNWSPTGEIDRKAWVDKQRKIDAEEKRKSDIRIGEWCLRFIERGYTLEDHANDVKVVIACANVLCNGPDKTWERIFTIHIEKIIAAEYCREKRLLPAVKRTKREKWCDITRRNSELG